MGAPIAGQPQSPYAVFPAEGLFAFPHHHHPPTGEINAISPQAGSVLLNEIVPRLKSAIPNTVCFVGSEDPQELIQDATAFAAKLLHGAETAGKRVTPGNIAYYVILHMRSGRRSTGSSIVDVMATGTQLNGHTHLVSLEELVPMEEINDMLTLGDVLSTDHEDPGMVAARTLDWEAFCETQPSRSNAILDSVAQDRPLTELAEQHRVDRSTIQNNKAGLAREIKEFMGQDILQESTRPPAWRHNLVANRERLAWRKADKHRSALATRR